jgi:hypothetical protein
LFPQVWLAMAYPVEYAMVDGVESSALIEKSENDGIAIVERR